jgi:hypothetical protein
MPYWIPIGHFCLWGRVGIGEEYGTVLGVFVLVLVLEMKKPT